MRNLFSYSKHKTKAQAMVEFALALPVLLLLLFGMMETGRLLFIYASTVTAARQAARYGSATGISPSGKPYYQDCTGIQSAANRLGFLIRFTNVNIGYDSGVVDTNGNGIIEANETVNLNPANPACGAFTTAQNGHRIKVTVTAQWVPIVPLVPLRPFVITSSSERTILASVNIGVTGVAPTYVPTNGAPGLSISPSPTTFDTLNQAIAYTYTLTNVGLTSLAGPFAITDPSGKVTIGGCLPAAPASLAANATFVCTGTYHIIQADLNAGFVTNVATGTPSSSASNTIYATQNATISLVKTATLVVNGNVTYTYTMTNTGNVDLISYAITDDKLGSICSFVKNVAPGAIETCTMAHAVTPGEVSAGTLTNLGTANAVYKKYVLGSLVDTTIQATDSETVYTSDLSMTITGTVATAGELPAQTQTITYIFNVTNHSSGPLTLSGISIGSFSGAGVIPSITCTGVIASGTTKSCTAAVPYAIVQADIDNVNATTGANIPITITATATAGAFTAQATNATDPERHPAVSLVSEPTPNVATLPNTQVTYNYTITNSGNTTLSPPVGGFVVEDTNGGLNITCATPTATIAPGGTKLCVGIRFISQDDLAGGSVRGQASTSALFGITIHSAIATSLVITFPDPRLKLEITVPALIVSGAGASINYTYILTNTGGANLTGLVILPGYRGSTPVCAATALGLGASTTCIGSYVTVSTDVGTDVINNATANATVASTNINSNSASVTVAVIPPSACILTHGALDFAVPFGMTINNLNNYAVTVSQVEVYFDTTANPAPELEQVSFGGAVVWTGSDTTGHLTFSGSTIIPAGGTSIVATTSWKHPYAQKSPAERIVVHFAPIAGFICPNMDSNIAATVPNADLAITKTNGVSLVRANTLTTYTITVINNGPGTITSAILSDPAATGLSKTSVACSGASQCVTPPTVPQLESGTFALPALAAGQSYQITVVTNVTIGGGNVSNTATIAVPVGAIEAVPGNNSATDSDSVASPIADMHITKDNGTTTIASGSSTVYTITVTNGGPSAVVTGARLTDAVATGLSKTSVVCSLLTPGQCVTPPTVAELESGTFQLPTLTAGQTYQIKVTATVTALSGASVNNVAKVDTPAGTTDPISGDNSKTKTDTVTASNLPVDLSIIKTDSVTTINSGSLATYTIVITNSAANSADGAIFTDPAISGLNVATGGSVTCGIVTGGAVCPAVGNTTVALMQGSGIVIPTLPASSSIRFTVTGTVTATSGTLANTAQIAAPANRTDTNITNNDATDPADTVNPVDLAITKTDGITSINTGNVATYTIVVTNNGPASANGAKFTDPSISGLDVTTSGSVTCSGAACPTVGNTTVALMQGTGIVIPTLPSGSSVTFTVKGKVTATSGTIANKAQITAASTNTETNSANNADIDSPDTVTVPVCTTGDVTYTLTAVNGDSFVTWSVNNHLGISLPITSISLAWSGAGVGNNDYQVTSIGFTSTGTSFTSGNPPLPVASISNSPYTTGTGTLGSGISAFTITFSKQNPTVTGITITFASPHGACTHTSTPAVP